MAKPEQVPHGWMHGHIFILKRDVMGEDWNGHYVNPEFTNHPLPKGTKVKVVMVSRLGDCGITDNLESINGYIARVRPEDLELFAGL